MTPTLTIALLGAIESLLCARVADKLSGLPRHDPNQELMAQGIANFVVPFFGGMPATGTIARTVTNMRAGAHHAGGRHRSRAHAAGHRAAGRAAGAACAAGGAGRHPALRGLEHGRVARVRRVLKRYSTHYRVLMLGTFFLTVVFDLTVAVQVGLVLACVLFIRSMSSLFSVELRRPGRRRCCSTGCMAPCSSARSAKIDEVVQAVESGPRELVVVLDALQLVHLDASGLDALRQLHKAVLLRGGTLRLETLQPQPREVIERSGFGAELAANRASAEVSGDPRARPVMRGHPRVAAGAQASSANHVCSKVVSGQAAAHRCEAPGFA